jgi:hypothetical protein
MSPQVALADRCQPQSETRANVYAGITPRNPTLGPRGRTSFGEPAKSTPVYWLSLGAAEGKWAREMNGSRDQSRFHMVARSIAAVLKLSASADAKGMYDVESN